jgi:serine/threonine protein phosphatase PrpC
MNMSNDKKQWQIIGKTVRGASHHRSGLPNQDAIQWMPESGAMLPLTLAIADGHGSAQCFRSDVGAWLAVNTATNAVGDALKCVNEKTGYAFIKHWAEEKLPQVLERSWRDAVADHLAILPYTRAEREQLEAKLGIDKRRHAALNPALAYGSTLIMVVVTEACIIYCQLGDGEILTVTETGQVSRPLPGDDRLIANETTSLCLKDAWKDFRIVVQPYVQAPALILCCTDGYANSFTHDADFLKVGTDLLEIISSAGTKAISDNLESWLMEASRNGSGDDITMGIMYRTDLIEKRGIHGRLSTSKHPEIKEVMSVWQEPTKNKE